MTEPSNSALLTPEEASALLTSMSERERDFCAAYLKNGHNGKQAAISAGYAERSAEVTASRALRRDKVKRYLAHMSALSSERAQYGVDEFLIDLIEVKETAKTQAMADADPQAINAFRGIMETIGKHINIQAFKERLEVDHTVNHADAMERAIQRAERADRSQRLH